jgi:hypothetical protein
MATIGCGAPTGHSLHIEHGEREIHSCDVLINVLSVHYMRSTIHIPDNVSEPSGIFDNLQ